MGNALSLTPDRLAQIEADNVQLRLDLESANRKVQALEKEHHEHVQLLDIQVLFKCSAVIVLALFRKALFFLLPITWRNYVRFPATSQKEIKCVTSCISAFEYGGKPK